MPPKDEQKTIKKYDFKEGLPQEFEILNIGALYKGFSEDMTRPHRPGFFQVLWFQKGSPTHWVDFNPVKIKPNTLLFIKKDSVQKFDSDGIFDGKTLLFTDDFFCKTAMDTQFLKSTVLFNDLVSVAQVDVADSAELFEGIFSQIELEVAQAKDDYQSDLLRNYLRSVLLHSERSWRAQGFVELKKGANLDYVVRFRNSIEESFLEHKSVGFYSDQLHITPKRLNQATRAVLDKSPKVLIDDRVLLEAKRLLAHTNESIKQIGFSLGFEEPTNFIKYFRKHTAQTPADFRVSVISA